MARSASFGRAQGLVRLPPRKASAQPRTAVSPPGPALPERTLARQTPVQTRHLSYARASQWRRHFVSVAEARRHAHRNALRHKRSVGCLIGPFWRSVGIAHRAALLITLAAEHGPALRGLEGYRRLFSTLRADGTRFRSSRVSRGSAGSPVRLAALAALWLVAEAFIREKGLFASRKNKFCSAIQALQDFILVLHRALRMDRFESPLAAPRRSGSLLLPAGLPHVCPDASPAPGASSCACASATGRPSPGAFLQVSCNSCAF